MKNIVFIFGVCFIALLNSCSSVYSEHKEIKDLKWFKKDTKIFEVEITKAGEYDLFFAMRHSIGYPFTSIKINIEHLQNNGQTFVKEAEFPTTDENGKYIGEVTGQLWDIESVFAEKTYLNKGKHIFKISHAMNSNPVILVVDVGLIIKESSKS